MNTMAVNTNTHFSDEILLGFAKKNLDQLWAARVVADELADRIEADVVSSRVRSRSAAA